MALNAGDRLGPYEVTGAIGAGGMGEVYKARDSKLNRDVALKVLPMSLAADADRLARFRREAQVLAALNHPHIAQIYGFEDSGSTHALVMELVDGPTLAEIIAGHGHAASAAVAPSESAPAAGAGVGPRADGVKSRGATASGGGAPRALEVDEALRIARQIADALEAAHERGIVHRDLKPANIKVRPDGTVKVLDFGLAKAADPASMSGIEVANSPTLTARATQLGLILGTAAYMAPEQARGKVVDKRADIWAFGVVLYEMLTGQRVFDGDDVSDVLAAVLRQEVDWKALPVETPPGVRRLLTRCLERDPKHRLRDIGDAWLEIDGGSDSAAATSAAMPASAVGPGPSRAGRIVPWAAAAVIAAGSLGWALLRTPPPPARHVTRAIVTTKGTSIFVALSRDGTRLAYNALAGSNNASLMLRMMDQFDGKPIPGSDGAAVPLFSPDGQWIAYSTLDSPRKIRKIPVTGGTSITICDGDLFGGADWSEDDTIIFGNPTGLMRVPAAGGTPQALTKIDKTKNEAGHIRPQFLPGGKQILFTVLQSTAPDEAQFAVLDLATGAHKTIAKGGFNGRYAPSGHLTYVRNGTLFALPFDLGRQSAAGAEVPVVEGISSLGPDGTADYTFSAAGLLVYVNGDTSTAGTILAWADRTGKTEPLPGQSQRRWGTGRLSPNGRIVANGIQSVEKDRDIWVFDVERGTPTRLTFGGFNDNPIWSPDGTRVVYAARQGKAGLYSVVVDGSGKPELVATADSVTPTSFAPDGKTVLFDQVGPDKRRQIFTVSMPVNGQASRPAPLHEGAASEVNAQVSPDGRWVAYQSAETGAPEIYIQPFPRPGAKTRISTQGGTSPRWSRNGRELFYWGNVPATLMAVDISAGAVIQPGPPRPLFQLLAGTTWDVTPAPDRFLIEQTSQTTGSKIATVTDWFEELRLRAPAKK